MNGGLFMDKDIIFKSSIFGGFNKQDVTRYLAAVNAEKSELLQKYSAACSDATSFLNKITKLEQSLEKLEPVSQQLEIEKLKSAELEKEKEELAAKNEEILKNLKDVTEEKEKLLADRKKLKSAELQLGAAMLDARLHSENLVSKANEKISNINRETGEAITKTANKMGDISADISELATVFNNAIAKLEERMHAIVKDMSGVADGLIKDSKRGAGSNEEKIKDNSDDDIDGDSSGSVYIFG